MIEKLYKQIQSETAGMVGNTSRQSLPILAREKGSVVVKVLLVPTILKAPKGSEIMPPTHVATYDPSKGALVELKAVRPSDFGQSHPAGEVIGTANLPAGMNYQDYMQQRGQLFQALDQLLPAYAAQKRALSDVERGAARRFWDIFPILREPALEPYYKHALQDFTAWLSQIDTQ